MKNIPSIPSLVVLLIAVAISTLVIINNRGSGTNQTGTDSISTPAANARLQNAVAINIDSVNYVGDNGELNFSTISLHYHNQSDNKIDTAAVEINLFKEGVFTPIDTAYLFAVYPQTTRTDSINYIIPENAEGIVVPVIINEIINPAR